MPVTEKTQFTMEPGSSLVHSTRLFDAPPEKVFAACTEADKVQQWWGPRAYEVVIDEFEPVRGGKWRILHRGEGGDEYGFHGVFHEVTPGERVVQTFEYEGMPGHPVLEHMTLTPEAGGTRLTVVSAFISVEDRDGMAESGMEQGASESHDRLQELLDTM